MSKWPFAEKRFPALKRHDAAAVKDVLIAENCSDTTALYDSCHQTATPSRMASWKPWYRSSYFFSSRFDDAHVSHRNEAKN